MGGYGQGYGVLSRTGDVDIGDGLRSAKSSHCKSPTIIILSAARLFPFGAHGMRAWQL